MPREGPGSYSSTIEAIRRSPGLPASPHVLTFLGELMKAAAETGLAD
jgi:hypothetical protein